MLIVGKRARVLVQRYGPFFASLIAVGILAALLLVLLAVSLLAQPAEPLPPPEVFDDHEVLAALRGNVSKVSGQVGELRGRASLLAADRERVRYHPALVKTLRMIPLLRAHEQDFRRLIRSLGTTPFDESEVGIASSASGGAPRSGGAPEPASPGASASSSASSHDGQLWGVLKMPNYGGATVPHAHELDSEVATCARRDCARRTQCRYLELEKRWREVQGTTRRYDPRAERFLDVPWELDPAKIWYLFPEVHACSSQVTSLPLNSKL